MNDQMPTNMDQPKQSNNTLMIAAVAVVLLCCCCIGLAALWQYGDVLVQSMGL